MKKTNISEELLLYTDVLPVNVQIVTIGGIDKKHDKSFKNILSEVDEMSKFLSQYLGWEVKKEDLEKYKNSFITKQYKNKESDTIYKHKNKEIYYLIEHQSTIDVRMPNRMLSYYEELIEDIYKNKKMKKINPVIVPIVIYTGSKGWKVPTNFSSTQKCEERYKKYLINLEYELIDISNYTKQQLLEKDTKFSSMMLIEKYDTSEQIKNVLIELINLAKNQERIDWIKEVLTTFLKGTLERNDEEIIWKIIEEKEKNNMDEEWIARVKRNNKRIKEGLINKGKLETLKEMVKNMLKYNETDEKIMNYTKIEKSELEKIK